MKVQTAMASILAHLGAAMDHFSEAGAMAVTVQAVED
jgi:hypothetical protein